MSLLSELEVPKGATKKRKRIGRGDGSGWGGTAAKGHKGQKARSGGKIRRGFEGGQMPLVQRLPKFGFNKPNPAKYSIVSLEQLNQLDGEITPASLLERGFAKKNTKVKILANGEISKSLTVKANKFSAKAKAAIEAAGGTTELI